MNELFQRFLDRPLSHKLAMWIGSLVLLCFVFWQYIYSAKLTQQTNLQEQVYTLESQIAQETRLAKNLKKFTEEVKELDIKFKFALQELPNEREIPDLLATVSGLIRDAGLQPLLFKPNAEIHREFYAEVPVSISVEGTFHQVATFFDEVGQLPRIININQITVRDPVSGDKQVNIKADCIATTFRYLDESERIKAPQQNQKGKRKRK